MSAPILSNTQAECYLVPSIAQHSADAAAFWVQGCEQQPDSESLIRDKSRLPRLSLFKSVRVWVFT